MRLLVTGGAGFIGSAFVRHVLEHYSGYSVITLDKLTYAGNLENLASVEDDPRHRFVKGDICDSQIITSILASSHTDAIVHFAAESHVDRSILSPASAIETNIRGTALLLEAARTARVSRFLHVSTDEVYGSMPDSAEASETSPVRPSSPYAASKAAADLLALAYAQTYGFPVVVTRAANNYGPYQFPEKLIPLMITNALDRLPLPVYGDGRQVRDWLHVDDHCAALMAVLLRGRDGEVYNVGGGCSLTNLDVVTRILDAVGAPHDLIRMVADRPAHDRRYALNAGKITQETGFSPRMSFEEGMARTIAWYRENTGWTNRVKSGGYRDYYRQNYEWRALDVGGASPAVSLGLD